MAVLQQLLSLVSWPVTVLILGLAAMVIFREPLTHLVDRTRRITKTGLEADAPHPPGRALLIFGVLLTTALFLKIIELQVEPGPFSTWAGHISVAFIVAGVLGFTYEYLLYQERVRTLRGLLEESREKVFEALRAYGVLTPADIFQMLKDIASQTDEIPTLYVPAREEAKEYTFSESIRYFDALVKVRRKEIVDILGSWIEPKSHLNVKFLASDFIGEYQLDELAERLLEQAEPILHAGKVEDANRDWVLNYIWAASRCENPQYRRLGEILRCTSDEKIEAWILFVPVQMPSKELGEIIDNYLRREAEISPENLKRVVRAAAALQKAEKYDGLNLLKRHKDRFCKVLQATVEEIWRNFALGVEDLKGLCAKEKT